MASYSRLNAFDRTFLDIEDSNTHMHVAATCVFDATPLATGHGGVDVDRIRRYVEGRLHSIPRYRQRIAYVPVEGHPVWVDDPSFNLTYHIRHISLPRPGDDEQLRAVIAWIQSQPLDRSRPLWEMWILEGLEGSRFAIVQKIHHCLIDGLAGAEEMRVLLSPDPDSPIEWPRAWQPTALPSAYELVRGAVAHRLSLPLTALHGIESLVRTPLSTTVESVTNVAKGLLSAADSVLRVGSPTPLNRPIGRQRRFASLALDLAEVKAVKQRLGGTINDVVLAATAGALRRYLQDRGKSAGELEDLRVRAMCPVARRRDAGDATAGNKVAGMFVGLPVGQADPRVRYEQVRAAALRSKSARHDDATAALATLSEWTTPWLMRAIEGLAPRRRCYNLIVTNIPGPPIPLYLLGARMLETFPTVPLFPGQALAVALFSYAGGLYWGFNADRDVVRDLDEFVVAVRASFEELRQLARIDGRNRPTDLSHQLAASAS